MTESEWNTSTDPAAMYNFVRDRVTERQGRFIDNALYKYYDCNFPAAIGSTGGSVVAGLCDILREIIGNPFRYSSLCGVTEGIHTLDDCVAPECINCKSILTWNNSTVPNLIRSMMEEECGKCQIIHGEHSRYVNFGPDSCWVKCSCNNGYVPRAEPQWEMMPIIAGALEEAGCTEAAILDHLRENEQCPYCDGDGARFYDDGERLHCKQRCDDCTGTGKRPVRHVRGCWVIELLKE